MKKKPSPTNQTQQLFGSDPIDDGTSSSSTSVEKTYMFRKEKSEVVAVYDPDVIKAAQARLNEIRDKCWNSIPAEFRDRWSEVALYSPRGDAANATGLMLEVESGAYDINNRLNHLTGRQWVKMSCSWFIFNAIPSDLAEERRVAPESEKHPATFSPSMISDFIRFFTKEGDFVLDPFMGIGTTLVACRRTMRVGFGIELNPEFFDTAQKRVPEFKGNMWNDSIERVGSMKIPEVSLIISSPPYWDVLNRSTKDFQTRRDSRQLQSNYSASAEDLGNVTDYEEFIQRLVNAYRECANRLKPNGHMVVIVKNVKKAGVLYPLAWDLARELSGHLTLKDERIWIQDKAALAPYGYPHSWVSNILHHYCLIFQKSNSDE
jgi:DNA modification methylase